MQRGLYCTTLRAMLAATSQKSCMRAPQSSRFLSDKDSSFGDAVIEYTPYEKNSEFIVPSYPTRTDESDKRLRARLLYQSRKRGISENCLILSTFFAEQGGSLSREMLDQFDRLINLADSDWDIYYWMTGKDVPPPPFDNEILSMLQEFTQNKDMQDRTRQPDL